MALSALESLDMARLAGQRADTLSGGQQQRVAIARALVQEPDIILADEPIASLDPRNTKVVMDALLHINKHFGITVVCNLHSLDIARSYCDRLVGMAAGRVVFDGVPAALTDAVARDLYGLEAGEVDGRSARPSSCRRAPVRLRPRRLADPVHAPSTRRNPHAHPSPRPGRRARRRTRRRRPGLTRQDWKAKYPELVMAVVPAENASGVTERYAPFVEYLSKELGTKVTLRVANDYAAVIEGQRNGSIHLAGYGPASYARAIVTGVEGRAVRHHREQRRHDRLLLGLLCEGRQPLQDDRRSQGQEPRPGRSQLDLGQQRAALCPEQDEDQPRDLLRQGHLHRQPRERGDRPAAGHRRRRRQLVELRRPIPTSPAWPPRTWRRRTTSASSTSRT